MHHLVVAAELGVFVADLMEAVRADRHDRSHSVAVQRLDVCPREHLIQVLVPHPAGRIAVALLLLAEDGEPDAGRPHHAGEVAGDAFGAVIERAHASHPEQHFGALAARLELGEGRNVETMRPCRAVRRTECPR
jgi:hypothetical protein